MLLDHINQAWRLGVPVQLRPVLKARPRIKRDAKPARMESHVEPSATCDCAKKGPAKVAK